LPLLWQHFNVVTVTIVAQSILFDLLATVGREEVGLIVGPFLGQQLPHQYAEREYIGFFIVWLTICHARVSEQKARTKEKKERALSLSPIISGLM
jgi:hypothetical protein